MNIDLGWGFAHVTPEPGVTQDQVEAEVRKALNLIADGDF